MKPPVSLIRKHDQNTTMEINKKNFSLLFIYMKYREWAKKLMDQINQSCTEQGTPIKNKKKKI